MEYKSFLSHFYRPGTVQYQQSLGVANFFFFFYFLGWKRYCGEIGILFSSFAFSSFVHSYLYLNFVQFQVDSSISSEELFLKIRSSMRIGGRILRYWEKGESALAASNAGIGAFSRWNVQREVGICHPYITKLPISEGVSDFYRYVFYQRPSAL